MPLNDRLQKFPLVHLGYAISESSNGFPQSMCKTTGFEARLKPVERKGLRKKGILKNIAKN